VITPADRAMIALIRRHRDLPRAPTTAEMDEFLDATFVATTRQRLLAEHDPPSLDFVLYHLAFTDHRVEALLVLQNDADDLTDQGLRDAHRVAPEGLVRDRIQDVLWARTTKRDVLESRATGPAAKRRM